MRHSGKIAIVLAAVLLVTFAIMFSGSNKASPPHYNGRSLEQWRRTDFHKFREAALTVGTNAIPYLVSELSATDPPIRTFPQRVVERLVSVGEVFTTFRGRRFDASCVLISFDTNAIPAVLSEAFSASGPGKDDLVLACAEILARCKSAEGNAMIEPVLLDALRSEDVGRIHAALLLATFREQQSAEIMSEVSRIESTPAGRVQEGIRVFRGWWPKK